MNLRRAKMQRLKREMDRAGIAMALDTDADPEQFSGMRRLRVLHKKALEAQASAAKSSPEKLDDAPVVSNTTTTASPTPPVPHLAMVSSEDDGFISGMSTGGSIALVVGCGVLAVLIGFVIYKYSRWRPKQIARKGYRAVAKSKGLQEEGPPTDGIIRAGTRPEPIVSPKK